MKQFIHLIERIIRILNYFSPLGDLMLRAYVANAFLKAGMVKTLNWDSTVWLFENEYHVPVLKPLMAAYLATGIEIVLPVLLIVGLTSRFCAFILLIYNVMAVVSYPELGAAGVEWHVVWGLILLVIVLRGPGKLSLDAFFWPKLVKYASRRDPD